jgi:hypothetical protein
MGELLVNNELGRKRKESHRVWDAVSLEKMRQELEADHSPSSNTEVKYCGTISPLPHTSSWRDV